MLSGLTVDMGLLLREHVDEGPEGDRRRGRGAVVGVYGGKVVVAVAVAVAGAAVAARAGEGALGAALVGARVGGVLVLAGHADVQAGDLHALGLERTAQLGPGLLEDVGGVGAVGGDGGHEAVRGLAQAYLDSAELGRVQRELRLDLPAVLEDAQHRADVVGAHGERRDLRGREGLGRRRGLQRRRGGRGCGRVDRRLLGGGAVVVGRRGGGGVGGGGLLERRDGRDGGLIRVAGRRGRGGRRSGSGSGLLG